jgi:hypothetical protein
MKHKTSRPTSVLQNDPTTSEEIVISGKKITVHVGTFVMALRRETLRAEMVKSASDSMEEQIARYNFFAPMWACSTGDVPTEAEFLQWSDEDVNTWYQLVVDKNPKWFVFDAESGKKKN